MEPRMAQSCRSARTKPLPEYSTSSHENPPPRAAGSRLRQPYLARLGVLTHRGLVRGGQLGRVVVHVQDADTERCSGHLGVVV